MYRDEVLAISEGVVDAYRKGVEEGKRDVGPYIIGLERAVKELTRVVSDLARKDVRVVGDTEEDIQLLNAKNKDLAEILNRLIRDAKSAIDASGIRHLRRDAWWDGVVCSECKQRAVKEARVHEDDTEIWRPKWR